MRFEPPPPNDFDLFIRTYFDRCRQLCPKIRAIAGKWRFEDLIPGLSDFDTRFLVADDTSVEDWSAMSIAVGRVHSELAREVPRWARILEHLPGLNLTFAEVTDPIGYYPEFHHWTFYHGDEGRLAEVRRYLSSRPWDQRDEAFHLKKFATYFGPYQRGIDPPVNLGPWENKYPLHSRYMHYFTPPLQAAVALVQRRAPLGKLESLRQARDLFPCAQLVDDILRALQRHYEVPEDFQDDALQRIERSLDESLRAIYSTLAHHVTLIEVEAGDSPQTLREKVSRIPAHPAQQFYDAVRFCRFMKGRLMFYSQEIAWFDTAFLIRNELGRIVKNFYHTPLRVYGQVRFGQALQAEQVLGRLRGELISVADCDGMEHFAQLASTALQAGGEKLQARAVAEAFDPVLRVAESLGSDLRSRLR